MPRKLKPSLVRWITIKIFRSPVEDLLRWEDIEALVGERAGGITRQSLYKQPHIAAAYAEKRQQHRRWKNGEIKVAPKKSVLAQSRDTSRRLRLIISQQEEVLAKYDTALASMLLAARDAGVPQELLMRPLPALMKSALPHLSTRRRRG